ncbi:hypothetical protein MCC02038_19690 [Bifidobacteriaceae bacterium MCC02038]|nr:hypothetical protein MCC02038_19690 [Bifidobacteriaceae bacterium MCC02038]
MLGFENAGRVSPSHLLYVDFPAFYRLFADDYPILAVVNNQDLLYAISRVALVAERNSPIRMLFTGHELAFSAGSADDAPAY